MDLNTDTSSQQTPDISASDVQVSPNPTADIQRDPQAQKLSQAHANDTSSDAEFAALQQQTGYTDDAIAKDNAAAATPQEQVKKGQTNYDQLQQGDAALAKRDYTTGADLTSGVLNFAKGAGQGLLKWGEQIYNGAKEMGNWVSTQATGNPLFNTDPSKFVGWDFASAPVEQQMGMVLGRYVAPLAGVGAAADVMGLEGAAHTFASNLGASVENAMTADPGDKNLADVMDSFPRLHGYIPEFLISKPDDSKAVLRIKNGISSMLGGEVLMTMGKAVPSTAEALFNFVSTKKATNAITELQGAANKVVPEITNAEGKVVAAPITTAQVEVTPEQKDIIDRVSKLFNTETPTQEQFSKAMASPDFQSFMQDVGLDKQPAYAKAFEELRGGTVSKEEMQALATTIASDSKQMNKLFARNAGEPISAPQLVAMMMHVESEFQATQKLIPETGKFTNDADLVAFGNQFAKFKELASATFSGSSEMGRGQRFFQDSWNSATSTSSKIKLMNQYLQISGGNMAEVSYFMKRAEAAGVNSAQVAAGLAKKGVTHKVADVVWEQMVNGMFGLKTVAKHAIGTGINFLGKPIGVAIANGLTPVEGMYAREGYAMLHGYREALSEATTAYGKAFFNEEYPKGMDKTWFGNRDRALQWNEGDAAWTGLDRMMAKAVNAYGYVSTTPTRAMAAGDLFFGTMAKRASIRQQAMIQTLDFGHEFGSDGFHEMYNRLANNPSDEMSLIADKFSKEQIFKSPLTKMVQAPNANGGVSNTEVSNVFFGRQLDGINKLFDKLLMGRLSVPFISLDGNMHNQLMERLPGFNMLTPSWKEAMLGNDPRAKAVAVQKMVMGSSMLFGTSWWVAHGMISGAGMRNYKLENALGLPDEKNKISAFGKTMGLEYFGVPGMVAKMAADMGELHTYLGTDDADKMHDLAFGAASILANHLTSEQLASNVDSYFRNIMDVQKEGVNLPNLATHLGKDLATMAPLHGVSKDASAALAQGDTKSYEADKTAGFIGTLWDATKKEFIKSYPYLFGNDINNLPVQRNIFGEAVKLPHGANPDHTSPFYTNATDDDPIRKELIRLGMHAPLYNPSQKDGEMHLRIDMPSRQISKAIAGQSQVVTLNPDQYDKLVKYSAGIGVKGITPLKDTLAEVIKFGDENKLSDEAKKGAIKKLIMGYQAGGRVLFMNDDTDTAGKLSDMMINRLYSVDPTLGNSTKKEADKKNMRQDIKSNQDPSFFGVP